VAVGSALGAWFSLQLPDAAMESVIGAVMLGLMLTLAINPKRWKRAFFPPSFSRVPGARRAVFTRGPWRRRCPPPPCCAPSSRTHQLYPHLHHVIW
jgi:uncharacterized membrane protein YfcA